MGQENVDDFKLLLTDEDAARAKLARDRDDTLAASADTIADTVPSLLTPTDSAALTGGLAAYLAYTGHEELAPGSEGWW